MRRISAATAFLFSWIRSIGQIICTPEDIGINHRMPADAESMGIMVPLQNVNCDQWKELFVPIDGGTPILVAMSVILLLAIIAGRKRNNGQ